MIGMVRGATLAINANRGIAVSTPVNATFYEPSIATPDPTSGEVPQIQAVAEI